jgi:MFS family permease
MTPSDRMSATEIRAGISLASIFGLRMLGLFLILPVFAVHARGLPGGDNAVLVGLALGIYGLTQGILQIPFGAASDRFGRKPVIVVGLILFAAGSFVAAAGQDIATVIVGRALQGAGAISAAVTAFLADATREQHRTKAMAMVGSTIGLTFALSLVGAPPLYAAVGMGGLFALTGVLSVAAIGVVLWLVPPAPAKIVHEDTTHWRDVVLDRELARLNFGIFVLHLVQMAMFMVVPVLLVERGGLAVAQHWRVYLPVVLLSFVLMLPPIVAAERHGRNKAVFTGAIVVLLAVQLGFLWLAPSVWTLALWMLLFFVAFNVLEAMLPSLTSRVAPPSQKGLALGVYNTTQAIGLAAGGILGGWIIRHFDRPAVFGCAAVLVAVWWLVARGMGEPPHRHAPHAAPLATEGDAH